MLQIKSPDVKVYHGYGHSHNLVVYGHVFSNGIHAEQKYRNGFWANLRYILRLFIFKVYPLVKVKLTFYNQEVHSTTAQDGFFKFEWESETDLHAGWHPVNICAIDDDGNTIAEGNGLIYVPNITQHLFISDIDDTVMISYSKTILKRLKELFFRNPHKRQTFKKVKDHYQYLAQSYTDVSKPNPFFYVSSSEWNLYDYLSEIFRYNGFPEGVFLLNQIKTWKQLFKVGKTGHEGKLIRIMRIIDAFPNQRLVLFGDNSQRDPDIYAKVAEKYAANISAVYIRNVRPSKQLHTLEVLQLLEQKGIHTCLFVESDEAIHHSIKINLIDPAVISASAQ